jgi:predicted nucleotidyltransferase
LSDPSLELLRDALRRAGSALKRAELPFALAGGYALWAYGGPEPNHDVDFAVLESDADRAAKILAEGGFEIDRPPEDWLLKACLDEATVDVLHRIVGVPVDEELLRRAEEVELLGVRVPVLPATDVLSSKLRSMTEHYCDFAALLPGARAVREQIDWGRLRAECGDNDFAAAFLFLLQRLGIAPPPS